MPTTKYDIPTVDGSQPLRNGPAQINASLQAMDDIISVATRGLLSARPVSTTGTPGKFGRLYYTTDTGSPGGRVFFDTGTSWIELAQPWGTATSLPAAPLDGQECYYVASATAGIIWHLRYRAAAPAPYRWEVLGAPPPLMATAATTGTQGGTGGLGAWTAVGMPSVPVPLAGDYDVEVGFYAANKAGNVNNLSVNVGVHSGNPAVVTVGNTGGIQRGAGAGTYPFEGGPAFGRITVATAAGRVIVPVFATDGNTNPGVELFNPWVAARPVRVG